MVENYSVVVPAYNAAGTIAETLDSILRQSVPPAEIIVVDDGSTDATAQVARARDPLVTLISQTNRGCGAASNTGIARVTTDYIAFLDADDIWLPDKARRQLAAFAATPALSGVFSRVRLCRQPSTEPDQGSVIDLWSRTTLMIRTTAARRIGDMIDPPGMRGDMVDWIARGRDLGMEFEMLQDTLALRRIRPGSLAFGRDADKDRGYLIAVKRALDRRRAGQSDDVA
ncbi:MAG: glycosyltransferase family 2 protein [Hydrogenophilales bacterium]|nr:glycosyltransferase family 2 protein [Hydrogenophilales bacterium]